MLFVHFDVLFHTPSLPAISCITVQYVYVKLHSPVFTGGYVAPLIRGWAQRGGAVRGEDFTTPYAQKWALDQKLPFCQDFTLLADHTWSQQ